jgi:hypothetical protein
MRPFVFGVTGDGLRHASSRPEAREHPHARVEPSAHPVRTSWRGDQITRERS